MKFNNKNVRKIKLALTTSCNADCNYCFVKKTNEVMPLSVARAAVDLLIESQGEEKLLSIYGGEPFLEIALFKNIVQYAFDLAIENKKKLVISVATSLTILDDDLIAFIKTYDIKISVSLAGDKKNHNQYRFFKGGSGTYDVVLANLLKLRKKIPLQNIGISFVIIPSQSKKIYDYFTDLLALGVSDNINFEIVQEFEDWTKEYQDNFIRGYEKVLKEFLKNIGTNGMPKFYINPVNWEFDRQFIGGLQGVACPFQHTLEVYPSGEVAFSPFLLNRDDKKKFVIANLKEKKFLKYEKCSFDITREECQKCEREYYGGVINNDHAHIVRRYYYLATIEAVKYFRKKIEKNKYDKSAIQAAIKARCF
ncbi:radical SAM protein [Candidatus Parcubacteria bacterium]|nr:radical SAM protein [Patescibacteria group bacterium]MBU4309579.1 radical SAM protein [Patescibacteria group bacterium]MBU4432264.1 radical SAM protein [Patescibacteria group bacterium]MBU4578033.1 radical SAM protein [Patescibacteria group bacterium]MCG2696459.1 radical SAM protein [Candidatus Parcubacteria bacterium]